LLRLVVGIVLIWRALDAILKQPPTHVAALYAIAISAGLLLVIGLWTPVAGSVLGILELRNIFWKSDDPWISILLGAMALALALVGPGFCSIDARLYGWKVVNLPRKGTSQPPE
jgi:putative oxidoreductase